MLRESADIHGLEIDLAAVLNSAVDSGVPQGRAILGFVDAAVLADPAELPVARGSLLELAGGSFVTAAAGVIATFQLMNRLVDALGVPVDGDRFDDFVTELGVDVPDHAHSRSR